MPVVVTAVFRPTPGRKDDLVEALRTTMPAVHAERGCLLYAIHDAEDGTITMIEKWDSAEDLDAHGSGPAVRPAGRDRGPRDRAGRRDPDDADPGRRAGRRRSSRSPP